MTMTAPAVDSPLDPEFIADLVGNSEIYDSAQTEVDESQWVIASKVNSMWDEHRHLYYPLTSDLIFPTKDDYFAECSRVLNLNRKRKRFSESGETLRRWCNVQATYANFEESEGFLEALSFEHLRIAKKLNLDGKVKAPVLALAQAVENKWTADEMKQHFDPDHIVHPADKVSGWLDGIMDKTNWSWLKSRETIKGIMFHAAEIKRLISEDK